MQSLVSHRSIILQNFHYNPLSQVHHRYHSKGTIETKEFPPQSSQSQSNANNEDENTSNEGQKVDPERGKRMQLFVFQFAIMECVVLGGLIYYLYVLRPRRIEEATQNGNSMQQINDGEEDQDTEDKSKEEEINIHSFFDLDHKNGKINTIVIACVTMTVYLRIMLNLI